MDKSTLLFINNKIDIELQNTLALYQSGKMNDEEFYGINRGLTSISEIIQKELKD